VRVAAQHAVAADELQVAPGPLVCPALIGRVEIKVAQSGAPFVAEEQLARCPREGEA
jgi:hypothetical protein